MIPVMAASSGSPTVALILAVSVYGCSLLAVVDA